MVDAYSYSGDYGNHALHLFGLYPSSRGKAGENANYRLYSFGNGFNLGNNAYFDNICNLVFGET